MKNLHSKLLAFVLSLAIAVQPVVAPIALVSFAAAGVAHATQAEAGLIKWAFRGLAAWSIYKAGKKALLIGGKAKDLFVVLSTRSGKSAAVANRALQKLLEKYPQHKPAIDRLRQEINKVRNPDELTPEELAHIDEQFANAENSNSVVTQNKTNGIRREKLTEQELIEQYPEASVQREQFLRNEDGSIAKDPETGTGRRIDHVVIDENGNALDSVETTSTTSSKRAQILKERRIRDDGGQWIKNRESGEMVDFGETKTKIIRRE